MASYLEKIGLKKLVNSHYRMERFSVTIVVLFIAMAIIASVCLYMDHSKKSKAFDGISVYTPQVTFSRSDVRMNVGPLYVNNDRTRMFLLYKFEDTKSITLQANKYKAFLVGVNGSGGEEKLKASPAGGLYVFGSSGYMGLYLVNDKPFPSQRMGVFLRSDVVLSQSGSSSNSEGSKNSTTSYDVAKMYINPGAESVKHIDALDSSSAPSVKEMYQQMVGRTEEAKIRDNADSALDDMRLSLNDIAEYMNRLDQVDGVQLPPLPDAIRGDKIVRDSDGNLRAEFASVVPGGYNFDWRSGSIEKGYLDQLMKDSGASSTSVDLFLASKVKERSTQGQVVGISNNITWTLKDGTKVADLNTGSPNSRYAQINADCQALVSAWKDFYSKKTKYQTEILEKFLTLEAVSQDIQTQSTLNTDDAVQVLK